MPAGSYRNAFGRNWTGLQQIITLTLPLHSERLADVFIQSNLKPSIHTFTHRRRSQPRKRAASSLGAVRIMCLAQGHLNTQLGGAGDRTSSPLIIMATMATKWVTQKTLSRQFYVSGSHLCCNASTAAPTICMTHVKHVKHERTYSPGSQANRYLDAFGLFDIKE